MRFKVSESLVFILIISVDLGLIMGAQKLTIARGSHDDGLLLFSAYVFVPSLSLLALSVIHSGIGLLKTRKASAFSTGYFLLGGLASFAVCLDLATHSFILQAIPTMADILQNRFFKQDSGELPTTLYLFHNVFIDIIVVLMFMLLQCGCGVIGGVMGARYGFRVILSERTRPPAA